MNLIDFDKYKTEKREVAGGGCMTGALVEIMNESMELNQVIALVQQKAAVVWVSDGRWSMHELLMALLDISGPAAVYISTYALSETPARILSKLTDSGMVTELYALIDNRVDVRTAGTLQIIKSICDNYSLVDTHAKVTVLQNEDWSITVIGSANYTENKRYEAGVILTTTEAAALMLRWMIKALNDGTK